MRLIQRTAAAMAMLLACGLGAAQAQAQAQEGPVVVSARDGSTRPLDARPTERSVVTFRDVLRAVYPDLQADGRAAANASAGGDTPPGPAGIDLANASASFAILSEGERDHVAMTLAGVLVMAEVAPEFRPTNALPIRTEREGDPTITQMLLLGEGRPAAVILNTRQDGERSIARYLIAAPIDGQLRQVFEGPLLYSVDTLERGCEPRRIEQRMLPVALRDAQRDGYAELSLTVRVARICIRRGRPRTQGTTVHYARLRWDSAQSRYLGSLDALERRNEQRMAAP
ncbi:hypothetical protein [Roseococcus pinisoli]|uniref:Uncharacterized protein n=1 Tax=Roseococcus pinisoli TaxID=2835040 RepID=A0ABS5QBR6_9PROT|nr:hypothetical protein [Roseococcus pinisoli]MBS7811137.1 hypothetical protein [Roseococcus pinisoli]